MKSDSGHEDGLVDGGNGDAPIPVDEEGGDDEAVQDEEEEEDDDEEEEEEEGVITDGRANDGASVNGDHV